MIRTFALAAAIAASCVTAASAGAIDEEKALIQIVKAEAAKKKPVMVFLRSGPIISGTLAGMSAGGAILTMRGARYYAATETPQRGDGPLFDSLDIRMSEVTAIGHAD